MTRQQYEGIVQEIRADLAREGERPSYAAAADMAESLIADDPDLAEYLKGICTDPVGRLAHDLV